MRWFEAARDRRRGKAAFRLQQRLAGNLDSRAEALLIAAVARWRQDHWRRFGKTTGNWTEDDCTVQVYRWSRECIRHDGQFALMTVQLERMEVTPAILHGHQSVRTASRPDLRIEVGAEGRSVECKRIALGSRWPRKYVHDGVARFVTGNYGHAESSGFMIGYASEDPLPDLVDSINGYITTHPDMGPQQTVRERHHSPPLLLGDSRHARSGSQSVSSEIGISHLLVALDM